MVETHLIFLSLDSIDAVFSRMVAAAEKVLFVSLGGIPLIILWLLGGGIFFTWRMGFINVQGFNHALKVASGKYDRDRTHSKGELSSFGALATALSGSVGLGNIAGVAIAIQVGGPGAVFWMTVAALLGMSSKFVECTLGLKYRAVRLDGTLTGGPMYYLSGGLSELGLPKLGKVLALSFAFFGIGAALGGGNMFQANQAFAAFVKVTPMAANYNWLFGIIAAILVGLVILGGISRISVVASRLIPTMVTVYIVACLWVLGIKFTEIPNAAMLIVGQGMSPEALAGGLAGALVQGVRRSAFSNNAGLGFAAIAHAAAKMKEPVREGVVAILEPFIDTVIICNLTALVVIITGTYGSQIAEIGSGSEIVAVAFETVIDWFPLLLTVIIFLFAFSTTIAWSYYGERCWAYLLGESSVGIFKILFLACIFVGSIVNLGAIVDFSDMMLLATAIPNLIGCMLLSGKVARDLKDYWTRLNRQKSSLKSHLNSERSLIN
ncbi:alanine/glycine:cation symporter family protein [Hydrococcus rivularis]|uniref:alanine/glycine:cation symporter family protein n=1 Tax=Hydrococcus rivularis TaxID=1616834 RepID=UPI0009F891E1|nr:alanine/glycine:cation symporter family protein [Hydrococcus rivularis]